MGVDNNGMLIVGVENKDFPYDRLSGFEEDDSVTEWAWSHRDEIQTGLELWEISSSYWRNSIIGFVIGDSGSYKYKKIEDIGSKIKEAETAFRELFGVEPGTFIMNRQW